MQNRRKFLELLAFSSFQIRIVAHNVNGKMQIIASWLVLCSIVPSPAATKYDPMFSVNFVEFITMSKLLSKLKYRNFSDLLCE